MRIASSEIQMQGSSSKSVREKEIEKLIYWEGSQQNAKGKTDINGGANGVGVDVDLSKDAKELIGKKDDGENIDNKNGAAAAAKDEKTKETDKALAEAGKNTQTHGISKEMALEMKYNKERMQVRLIEEFMTALTGKKFKIKFEGLEDLKKAKEGQLPPTASDTGAANSGKEKAAPVEQQEGLVGWGVSYERLYEREEHEKMNFKATGLVKTADGKEISLKLEVSMSRSLYERTYTSLKAGDALIDPLMVNYAGPAADLTEKKYSFDLDADGKEDQISFAGKGSGFLALDKNGDGKINDGKELFGTQSGDGFKDLASYDDDGNGWIDENDDIFNKLRIWTKDEKGNDKLLALGEVGIGAIYLDNVKTSMDIVGGDGKKNGQVAATGLFLRENGLAGSIQHVDIAI